MGSEADFINERMGGFDNDGLPNFMSRAGFADDSNYEKPDPDYFDTFKAAMSWAKINTGKAIIRSSDGNGYRVKSKYTNNRFARRR